MHPFPTERSPQASLHHPALAQASFDPARMVLTAASRRTLQLLRAAPVARLQLRSLATVSTCSLRRLVGDAQLTWSGCCSQRAPRRWFRSSPQRMSASLGAWRAGLSRRRCRRCISTDSSCSRTWYRTTRSIDSTSAWSTMRARFLPVAKTVRTTTTEVRCPLSSRGHGATDTIEQATFSKHRRTTRPSLTAPSS